MEPLKYESLSFSLPPTPLVSSWQWPVLSRAPAAYKSGQDMMEPE